MNHRAGPGRVPNRHTSRARTGETTVTGRLSADSIEGGCALLEAADGRRYELRWPADWLLDGRGDLVSPAGEVVARLGDEIAVRGVTGGGMSSTRQVGPILRVADVLTPSS